MKIRMFVTAWGLMSVAFGAQAVDGQKVYQQACAMCHATGTAGAPRTGDKAAWEARIAQGVDVLDEHAIKGFKGSRGVMPPKGGRSDLSDDAVMAAVAYMVDQVK
jgi:cytochrome c5